MTRLVTLCAAMLLAGCKPPTCDPQPLPKEYEDAAILLPAGAVVCGHEESPSTGVLLEFPTRDVKGLGDEVTLKLTAEDWLLGKNNFATDESVYINAMKNLRLLHLSIDRENRGPRTGRTIGRLVIVD
jgi:hypothetical protein